MQLHRGLAYRRRPAVAASLDRYVGAPGYSLFKLRNDLARWAETWAPLHAFDVTPFDRNDDKELQMRSPLAFPTSFKCPVRLYFGNQDFHLKAACQKLAELAKEKNFDVAAVEVPGKTIDPAMKQCIKFFQEH